MAVIVFTILCIYCVVLNFPTVKTASQADGPLPCPPDSAHLCEQPIPCGPGQYGVPRVGHGVPGSCCHYLDCLNITDTANSLDNCTFPECTESELECPPDSYRSLDEGCKCLPGGCTLKEVQDQDCPSGSSRRVKTVGTGTPGSCCDLYQCIPYNSNNSCTYNGQIIQNGSSWFRKDCTQCRCEEALIFCDSVGTLPGGYASACSPLPPDCTLSKVPPGECCPVCSSHVEEVEAPQLPGSCRTGLYGKVVLDGESWREDDCTTCVCKGGQRQCQAFMCEPCPHPTYEPGECCPRCNGSTVVTVPSHCPSLSNCSLRCVHGFVRDLNGCFTCHCQQDECLLDCPHGFAQDVQGNKLCKCDEPRCPPLVGCRKSCPHGYRTNKAGCEVCRCDSCKPLDKCTKRCAHGLALSAKNCVMCKCIPHDGHSIGGPNTTDTAVGTPCISDSQVWRDDGETWFDGCRQCYCLAGREMCSLLRCPPAPCATPVFNSSKDCCPSCPGTSLVAASHMVCQGEVSGQIYMEGDTWRLSPCVECVCQRGRALCHAASCPPTPCNRPSPPAEGECCPTCPLEQLVNYSLSTTCENRQGESMWREGNCVSCLCDDGQPSCFTELCDHPSATVSCTNALQVKNLCCPMCVDKPEGVVRQMCTVDNTTYPVGHGWQEDDCTSCQCIAGGEISCTKLVCSISCHNPVRQPGVCCHICPDDKPFGSGREVVYLVVLSVVVFASLLMGLYVARQCRVKRHQMKLHHYGCPPPQYSHTQYKYMPTYDSPQPTSEKTILTPL